MTTKSSQALPFRCDRIVLFIAILYAFSISCFASPNSLSLNLPRFKGPVYANMSWKEIVPILPDTSGTEEMPRDHVVSQDSAFHTITLGEQAGNVVIWNCSVEFALVHDSLRSVVFFNHGNWNREDISNWFNQSVAMLPKDSSKDDREFVGGWKIEKWHSAGITWSRMTSTDVEESADLYVELSVVFR